MRWAFHNRYYPKGVKLAWANHQSIRVKHFNCCPLHPSINKMFPSSGFQVAQTKFDLISANNHLSNVEFECLNLSEIQIKTSMMFCIIWDFLACKINSVT